MIEFIYNEEETAEAEGTTLLEPKNVKQIGEPKEYKKIFLEDFVHTFLQQYSHENGCRTSIAILLGNSERSGGKRHLYIKSALPVEGVTERQGKYYFTEKVWGDLYQDSEKFFSGQEIIGWFLARPGFSVEKNSVMEETQRTYFSGAEKVLYMLEPLEGESAFFGFDGNRFTKQSGYYIYYEKNVPMREFMLSRNSVDEKNTIAEKPDVAMANFRKILKEKQERHKKRKKLAISYSTKVAAALVLFVGIVAFQNSAKEPVETWQTGTSPVTENYVEESEGVIVEELQGNVEEKQELKEELPIMESPEPVRQSVEIKTEEVSENVEPAVTYVEYIVQEGDTLAKICRQHYGTDEKIKEICAFNEIENGDYIQAGEIILLP